MEIHEPPPIVRGICLSPSKCFSMPPKKAPPVKDRTQYYIHRMKAHAKSAQDPDMDMSLNEIKTGVKLSERMALTLEVYLLGVLAVFHWLL